MEKGSAEIKLSQLLDFEIKYQLEVSMIYNYEISQDNGISHITHYIASISNRAIHLIRGFVTLFIAENYSTAVSLTRLQIDNCIRLYAISLCNPEYLLTEIIEGNHVRRLKDRDGIKMTDAYLIGKLDDFLPGFKSLYEETSGFIHFSSEHLKINNKFIEKDDEILVETYIGKEIELTEDEKLKYIEEMYKASFNLYRLIYSFRYDSQNSPC